MGRARGSATGGPEVNVTRVGLCLVGIMLLVPTALAAPELTAQDVRLLGTIVGQGDASAVFAVADHSAYAWTLTAASGELTRLRADYVSVYNPLVPDSDVTRESDWVETHESFGPLLMTSTEVTPYGALLAAGDAARLEMVTKGSIDLASVSDPQVERDPSIQAGDDGELRQRLEGDFLHAQASDATLTLRGDIILLLHGPAYSLTAEGATRKERTGEYDTQDLSVGATGNNEFHKFLLKDAVLELQAPSGAHTYSRLLSVQLDGTLAATRAQGGLAIDGALVPASSDGALRWTGRTSLDMSPAMGAIVASAPESLATTGAIVSQGPSPAILTAAALLVLILLGAAGVFLYARRDRSADDLELALLAMDQRRWNEALPALTRLAKKEPTNATVQVDRALCLEQVGRFDEAARAFESALRAAPKHAEAHFYYARTLAKMSEREAARVHLETALERDPRLAEMARGEAILKGL